MGPNGSGGTERTYEDPNERKAVWTTNREFDMLVWVEEHARARNEIVGSRFHGNDLGEIRPDLDDLLISDSVCLRTSSCLPQSGDM